MDHDKSKDYLQNLAELGLENHAIYIILGFLVEEFTAT